LRFKICTKYETLSALAIIIQQKNVKIILRTQRHRYDYRECFLSKKADKSPKAIPASEADYWM